MFAVPFLSGFGLCLVVGAVIYFFVRVNNLERWVNDREVLVERLRSELASADASMFRLNDRIAQLETKSRLANPKPVVENPVVELFPGPKAVNADA